ncbi:MAG: hypothetical protein MJ247_01470 [Alphaproteobacteria bacterium]|nr:hypothetical protein [Alphaproteobacteria bacterium]
MNIIKHFIFSISLAFILINITACSSTNEKYWAQNADVIYDEPDDWKHSVDYMTYLKIKDGAGPLDQDYIVLSNRVLEQMLKDDLFKNAESRPKIALRDILNYNPNASKIRPAIIHEAVEQELMHSRLVWMTDGTEPYDYVLDVELSEVEQKSDENAEEKALGVMFVLFDKENNQVGEWFEALKREKGSKEWY